MAWRIKLTAAVSWLSLIVLCGCTHSQIIEHFTPAFVENAFFNKIGAAGAEADSEYCDELGREYLKESGHFHRISAVDGEKEEAGPACGSDSGDGSAGAAGLKIRCILKTLRRDGIYEPSYREFVQGCLKERGYKLAAGSGEAL